MTVNSETAGKRRRQQARRCVAAQEGTLKSSSSATSKHESPAAAAKKPGGLWYHVAVWAIILTLGYIGYRTLHRHRLPPSDAWLSQELHKGLPSHGQQQLPKQQVAQPLGSPPNPPKPPQQQPQRPEQNHNKDPVADAAFQKAFRTSDSRAFVRLRSARHTWLCLRPDGSALATSADEGAACTRLNVTQVRGNRLLVVSEAAPDHPSELSFILSSTTPGAVGLKLSESFLSVPTAPQNFAESAVAYSSTLAIWEGWMPETVAQVRVLRSSLAAGYYRLRSVHGTYLQASPAGVAMTTSQPQDGLYLLPAEEKGTTLLNQYHVLQVSPASRKASSALQSDPALSLRPVDAANPALERFQLVAQPDLFPGKFAIRTMKGLFLSPEPGDIALVKQLEWAASWEQWTFELVV